MSDRILTQSELSGYLRCKRKWWLGWYRQLHRKRYDESAPLTIGSLVHHGLEAYYRTVQREHPITAIRIHAGKMLEKFPEAQKSIMECETLAEIMLEGYMEWLEAEGEDSNLDIVGAEKTVEVPMEPPFRLRGKIDAPVVRRSDGLRLQLEHKTVGNLVDIPKTAQTNFQFLTYDLLAFLAAREESLAKEGVQRTDGIIVNMLRKVKRTASAKPPFYGRHEVRHNKEELRNHWRHVLEIAREMERTARRLDAGEPHQTVVPPTPARDCSYSCPFAEPCLSGMFDDGSDVEGFLRMAYEVVDPLARYNDDEQEER